MEESVKISLVTPCFNSEKTIRDTLESVEKQNYSNLEHIIVDGMSTDETLNIVNEYKNRVPYAAAHDLSPFMFYYTCSI